MLRILRSLTFAAASLCAVVAFAHDPMPLAVPGDVTGMAPLSCLQPVDEVFDCAAPEPWCGEGCHHDMGCGEHDCNCHECDECAAHCYGIRHHGCLKCTSWLHSTCDMYPHYAYYPENHGYYYFRPYNYKSVLEHQALAPVLGAERWNPYSVAMFDAIPQPPAPLETAQPDNAEPRLKLPKRLPKLEDLLDGREGGYTD